MIQVNQHKRVRKNGVSVVRRHSRSVVRKKYYRPKFHPEIGEMEATFKNGAKYAYHGMTDADYDDVMKDKVAAMAKLKKTKVYTPENDIAKKSFKSPFAKKRATALATKLKTKKRK